MYTLAHTKNHFQNDYKKNYKPKIKYFILFACLWLYEVNAATVSSGTDSPIPDVQTPSLPSGLENNRIARQLQAKFKGRGAAEFFDVIVVLSGPEKATAFQKNVGAFSVKHEFSIIHGFAAKMTKAQIQALANAPSVLHIQENGKVSAYIDDAKEDFGINAASQLTTPALTGAGVTICVIDTGIDTSHQQTDENVTFFCNAVAGGCNVDASGNAITAGEPAPFDDQGHGTAVTATAAGDGNPGTASTFRGVAPDADIAVAKVLDNEGSGSASDVLKGVEWCAGLNGVDILNLSLGENERNSDTNALTLAVNCVASPGWSASCAYPSRPAKVVVAAAGNSGPAQKQIFSPGEGEKVITAGGAYNVSEGGIALVAFSSRGPIPSSGLIKPDIIAPGVNITSASGGTVSGYSLRSGTSFSAPIVSGLIALMLEANPTLTPAQIKAILEETAQDWGEPGKDNDWGAGLLDAYASVQRALGTPPLSVIPWSFPEHTYLTGSLPAGSGLGSSWEYNFQVDDPNIPIAASMIIGGSWECNWVYLGDFFGWDCSSVSVGQELDMELLHGGSTLDLSACAGDQDTICGAPTWDLNGTAGRQETITESPPSGGFSTDFYTLRVFRASDVLGEFDDSEEASFIVEIQNAGGSVNLPPETDEISTSGFHNELIQVDLSGSDGNGTVDAFVVTSLPTSGDLYQNSDGTGPVVEGVEYSAIPANSGQRSMYLDPPAADFQYITVFEYAAVDNEGTQDDSPATVTVTVDPPPAGNSAPETDDVSESGPANTQLTLTLSGSDSDGTVTDFELTTLPTNGGVYLDPAETVPAAASTPYSATSQQLMLYYRPPTDWSGTTSFEYAAIDDDGVKDTTPATADITIDPPDPGGNESPIAAFSWECSSLVCTFKSTSSDPEDGPVSSHMWNFGDGQTSDLVEPFHTYSRNGTYTVELEVVDSEGASTAVSTPVEAKKRRNNSGSVDSGGGGSDTTPPGAPTGLVAIAGDGEVSLDWDDNVEIDFASYSVHRSTSTGESYSEVASGLGASSHVDSGLTNGTTYFYVVTAFDTSGNESASSSEASATPTGGGGGGTFCDTRPNHKRCQ